MTIGRRMPGVGTAAFCRALRAKYKRAAGASSRRLDACGAPLGLVWLRWRTPVERGRGLEAARSLEARPRERIVRERVVQKSSVVERIVRERLGLPPAAAAAEIPEGRSRARLHDASVRSGADATVRGGSTMLAPALSQAPLRRAPMPSAGHPGATEGPGNARAGAGPVLRGAAASAPPRGGRTPAAAPRAASEPPRPLGPRMAFLSGRIAAARAASDRGRNTSMTPRSAFDVKARSPGGGIAERESARERARRPGPTGGPSPGRDRVEPTGPFLVRSGPIRTIAAVHSRARSEISSAAPAPLGGVSSRPARRRLDEWLPPALGAPGTQARSAPAVPSRMRERSGEVAGEPQTWSALGTAAAPGPLAPAPRARARQLEPLRFVRAQGRGVDVPRLQESIARKAAEALDRRIVDHVETAVALRLSPGSAYERRLRDEIAGTLYESVVLEKERLGWR